MGLFSKKKITLDEILEALPNLTDEEKKALHEKTSDLYQAEDEREIDKIEEEKAEDAPEADEKADEVSEESKEIGHDVDEIEEEAAEGGDTEAEEAEEEKEDGNDAEGEEAKPYELEEEQNVEVEPPLDTGEQENVAETVKALSEKVTALEDQLASLNALKEEMEKYVEKQKDAFGYKGNPNPAKKDYNDMSSAELKAEILKH